MFNSAVYVDFCHQLSIMHTRHDTNQPTGIGSITVSQDEDEYDFIYIMRIMCFAFQFGFLDEGRVKKSPMVNSQKLCILCKILI